MHATDEKNKVVQNEAIYIHTALRYKHEPENHGHHDNSKHLENQPAVGRYCVEIFQELRLTRLNIRQCIIHILINAHSHFSLLMNLKRHIYNHNREF